MPGSKPQAKAKRSDAFILSKNVDDYVVRPAYAVIDGQTKEFLIRNLTGKGGVEITMLSRTGRKTDTKTLGARGRAVFKLNLTRKDECIRYTVKVNGRFARGESDPVIIIDPPAS